MQHRLAATPSQMGLCATMNPSVHHLGMLLLLMFSLWCVVASSSLQHNPSQSTGGLVCDSSAFWASFLCSSKSLMMSLGSAALQLCRCLDRQVCELRLGGPGESEAQQARLLRHFYKKQIKPYGLDRIA